MATTALVHRSFRVPQAIAGGPTIIAMLQQVAPMIYADSNGLFAWFDQTYNLDSSVQFQHISWMMTPANDAAFMANNLPTLLASLGLTSIQTWTEDVTVGY